MDLKKFYLEDLLNELNGRIRIWEDLTDLRANFGFRYDKDGRKEIYILDIGEAKEPPPRDALVRAAEIISEASDGSVAAE